MPPIIIAENISKMYRIGAQQHSTTFRDAFDSYVHRILHPKKYASSKNENLIWALKNVSFTIHEGEVVGIIGRNGAGKSNLLKILSRITAPTEGTVRMRGRVASLLEVGTGFSGELTGRDNIFLNGAILGMKRSEIIRKFDEIVSFAETGKFIDTPVKHYSSGMFMRLAFAVAAHLEPEILIIDEVLAVGDAQFQKKCIGKMEDVSKLGRTVLFVSHNMKAIRQLCSRTLLLRRGELVADGPTLSVTEQYLQEDVPLAHTLQIIPSLLSTIPDDENFVWKNIVFYQNGARVNETITCDQDLEIKIDYEIKKRTEGLRIYLDFSDDDETLLFRSFSDERKEGQLVFESGSYSSAVRIPGDVLTPMKYDIGIYSCIHNYRYCNPAHGIHLPINVVHQKEENQYEHAQGLIGVNFDWKTVKA
jgi:lipopolysaccharide transport system ATP-binding protein